MWEGDRRTPEGVYAIIDHSERPLGLVLTLNYPTRSTAIATNKCETRAKCPIEDGHPVDVGGRIGIHGTDEPELNRGDINWTTECISVDDRDVDELKRLLPKGTLVIINP